MDQNSENSESLQNYFKYMIIVLILVLILDNYTQFYSNVIPSKIVEEFLSGYPVNEANSIFALSLAIVSVGSYVVFVVWYSADKVGRKFLLVLSVFGMAFASLGILFSRNIVEYTIFRFLLAIFVGSDIWLRCNINASFSVYLYHRNITSRGLEGYDLFFNNTRNPSRNSCCINN